MYENMSIEADKDQSITQKNIKLLHCKSNVWIFCVGWIIST